MPTVAKCQIAVIFHSVRSGADAEGYARAAAALDALVVRQPGYVGMDSMHDERGSGLTISYWADEASATAWRDHPEHAAIRDVGRARWYSSYEVIVAQVTRSYDWRAP